MYDGVKAMIDAEKALRPKEVPVEELAEVKEIEKKLEKSIVSRFIYLHIIQSIHIYSQPTY